MANQDQGTTADGWTFRLVDDHLSITSQSDAAKQVQLSPQATFALITYLSPHRDALYWATQQQRDEPEPDERRHFSDVESAE